VANGSGIRAPIGFGVTFGDYNEIEVVTVRAQICSLIERFRGLFGSLRGVACRPDGKALRHDMSEDDGGCVRTVSASGAVVTFAGKGGAENAGFQDGQGAVAQFSEPEQIALDAEGNAYVAELGNNRIREITPSAPVTTFAGTGKAGKNNGACFEATFHRPRGVAVCPRTGNIIVADTQSPRPHCRHCGQHRAHTRGRHWARRPVLRPVPRRVLRRRQRLRGGQGQPLHPQDQR